MSCIFAEKYYDEARHGRQIGIPLPAFVDDGIQLSRSHQYRQGVLNGTSKPYSLPGLERNGGKCFVAEIDKEGVRA